jgi:hypothetical protein
LDLQSLIIELDEKVVDMDCEIARQMAIRQKKVITQIKWLGIGNFPHLTHSLVVMYFK